MKKLLGLALIAGIVVGVRGPRARSARLADGLRRLCLDEFDVAGDHAKRPHHRSPDNAVTARAVTLRAGGAR